MIQQWMVSDGLGIGIMVGVRRNWIWLSSPCCLLIVIADRVHRNVNMMKERLGS